VLFCRKLGAVGTPQQTGRQTDKTRDNVYTPLENIMPPCLSCGDGINKFRNLLKCLTMPHDDWYCTVTITVCINELNIYLYFSKVIYAFITV